jgi:hypothetical protein
MSLYLEFDTETAAFDDHIRIAVPHLLRNVAQFVALGGNVGKIRDKSGTHIGEWRLDHPEASEHEVIA